MRITKKGIIGQFNTKTFKSIRGLCIGVLACNLSTSLTPLSETKTVYQSLPSGPAGFPWLTTRGHRAHCTKVTLAELLLAQMVEANPTICPSLVTVLIPIATFL